MSDSPKTLDGWYVFLNRTYLDRNFYRDPTSIFAHLVEVIGGLSLLASEKQKSGVIPQRHLIKAIAWWMALCGKMGVKSIEDMLWAKFPYVCPYCHTTPHEKSKCRTQSASLRTVNWEIVTSIAEGNKNKRPSRLGDWHVMFSKIYPISDTEQYATTFARLTEELGELAEAVRAFPVAPGYFLSEASDLFAWLMHLHSLILDKKEILQLEHSETLEMEFANEYGNGCPDCNSNLCVCTPVLPKTLGRIAHEINVKNRLFSDGGALFHAEDAQAVFQLGTRYVKLGSTRLEVNADLLRDVQKTVSELSKFTREDRGLLIDQRNILLGTLTSLESISTAQRLTQTSLEELVQQIKSLPSGERSKIIEFLSGVASSTVSAALVKIAGG